MEIWISTFKKKLGFYIQKEIEVGFPTLTVPGICSSFLAAVLRCHGFAEALLGAEGLVEKE